MIAKEANECPACKKKPTVYKVKSGDIVLMCKTKHRGKNKIRVQEKTYLDAIKSWNDKVVSD